MTREEMLEKLHSIKPGAELTALPSEGALECEYVTSAGTMYEWIGMYDWPVACLRGVTGTLLNNIKAKLAANTLSLGDIEGTVFHDLYVSFVSTDSDDEDCDENAIINTALKSLVDISVSEDGELFAIFDSNADNPAFEFFTDYDSMATAFGDHYIGVSMRWDELDDDDLEQWIDRLENDFQGIPFATYGAEDDEE